ncbi:unnamed protein product, partial [marine sediment metagenome]
LHPLELIVVDYGSTEENHEKLMQVLPDCTVYRYETDELWSLAVARNIGLRRATARYSCALDADLIMEPRVLEVAHGIHNIHPRIYMSTRVVLLNVAAVDIATLTLPEDYEKLITARWTYTSEGWGGFVSAPTKWWKECQGFDERMKVWGWEDVDMWKRAARAGMDRRRLNNEIEWETNIYHLHHLNVQLEAHQAGDKEVIATIRHNERWTKSTKGILRNDENWGKWR